MDVDKMSTIPRRLNRRWLAIAVVPILVVGTLAALFYFGILHFNKKEWNDSGFSKGEWSSYKNSCSSTVSRVQCQRLCCDRSRHGTGHYTTPDYCCQPTKHTLAIGRYASAHN